MRRTHAADANERFAAVIMAAGKGTRMKDPERAKVMFEVAGRPMVHHVVDLALSLKASRVIAVVGHQAQIVEESIASRYDGIECVLQKEQLGTGHAVLQAKEALRNFSGDVLVLSGDVPLLRPGTMLEFIRHHAATNAVATILTADLDDPSGYGRIIRNGQGMVEKIVEHRDATADELCIREINSGIYLFHKETLFDGLAHIECHNVQNEYYLTDVFEYFWKQNLSVSALKVPDWNEIRGVNTVAQLEEARQAVQTIQESR